MFEFRRITLFCLEKRLSKHKMTIFSKNLGGAWPLWPPSWLRLFQAVQPFRLMLFLIKALTTIISEHIVYPCVRFLHEGSCLKFIKMRATPFLSFSCWNNSFYDCQCSKRTVEQRRLHENHVAYRQAFIHSTCNWNLQSELKVTHENAPTALPRLKNVIFRHHYVMQKTAVVLKLRKVIFAKFFTSTTKTCWQVHLMSGLQLMAVIENIPLNIKK